MFADKVNAAGDIALLIVAAKLDSAVVGFIEVVEVVRLKQRICEFSKRQTFSGVFNAAADMFLGDHLVDGEVFADVAQKFKKIH